MDCEENSINEDGYFRSLIPNFKFALREDLKEESIFLPTRSTPKSTGWDVRAAWTDKKSVDVQFGQYIKIPLGFRTFAPEGWWYELKPRSSTFGKKNLHALYGTIDEDYEGQLIFVCQYLPPFLFSGDLMSKKITDKEIFVNDGGIMVFVKDLKLTIDFGEAIGQLIPVKRQEMNIESINNEEYDLLCKNRGGIRGTGGFGSTNK